VEEVEVAPEHPEESGADPDAREHRLPEKP